MFADGNKKRSHAVPCEHVTKHVANVKNNIYRHDNSSLRIEKSKCHMIKVMHIFLETDVIFLIPIYYKFTQ